MRPQVDVIIPVHNEGRSIVRSLESLRKNVHSRFRVLICYDSDEDDTLVPLRSYQRDDLEYVLIKSDGQGPHDAVVTGFRESTAPAVLVFPADDDHNSARLDVMVEAFERGSDIVCASRFMPGGSMSGCPFPKSMLVRVSALLLRFVARVPTHDPSNGFRLFSRRVLDSIPIESTRGFTYSIELLVKCHRLKWLVSEIPVVWYERTQGRSRFRVFRWLPAYLRWFSYAFATTYLRRSPATVRCREIPTSAGGRPVEGDRG